MAALSPSARAGPGRVLRARPGPGRPSATRWWPALLADLVAVAVFVSIGRAAHSHALTLSGLVSTVWPFAGGLAAGWLVVAWLGTGRCGAGLRAGAIVWLSTVAVGMGLRAAGGQGVDATFVAVALAFLGLFLLGWRTLAAGLSRSWPPGPRP